MTHDLNMNTFHVPVFIVIICVIFTNILVQNVNMFARKLHLMCKHTSLKHLHINVNSYIMGDGDEYS